MLQLLVAILAAAPPTPKWKDPPAPKPPAVVLAGNEFNGVQVHTSTRDAFLVSMAQDYAEQMASIDSQSRRGEGHFGVEARYAKICEKLGMKGDEVTAESWPWQSRDSDVELWTEMFRSWKKFPNRTKHWEIVSTRHDRFGEGIAKSRRGIWYACILVADGETKLLAFTADWCMPCRQMHPVLEKIETEVQWIDSDKHPELVRQYRVTSLPTVIAVRGGREIGRRVGVTTLENIRAMIRP
jgi:thioredoxin 1